MLLVERLWTAVTAVLGVFTLSPGGNDIQQQTPMNAHLSDNSITNLKGSVATDPLPLEIDPNNPYLWKPPGNPHGDTFWCNYTNMPGWEPCSTAEDRRCWLKRIKSNETHPIKNNETYPDRPFDIFTDYEKFKPTGIDRYYELVLQDSNHSADGMWAGSAKLFSNGSKGVPEYPGPWIQACWGDTVHVKVTNKLRYNGTSVHWHGIRQKNTMHMDGVNGITQCPIAPGDSMWYKFETWQYGSSWYHSHYSVQYADGAHGGLTIHGPTSEPWDEAISPPLIMTDWSHDSAFYSITNDSSATAYGDILLDGLGNITKFRGIEPDFEILPPFTANFTMPTPGSRIKKYLLRIINTSFDSTFLFSIDNHWLTVIEADFVPISPYRTTSILVGIGQRYDIVVQAWPEVYEGSELPTDGNYWIRTFTIPKCFVGLPMWPEPNYGYERTGIIRYNHSSTAEPSSDHWPSINHKMECNDPSVFRYYEMHPVVPWQVGPPSNYFPWSDDFNTYGYDPGVSKDTFPLAGWYLGIDPSAPIRVNYSSPTFLRLHNKTWPPMERVEMLDFNSSVTPTQWVYLVIETQSTSHPIHLHGHDFAIIDAQTYQFNASNVTLQLDNPPRRDVVMLPHGEHTRGYVVIAFKVDNPGAWIVHCHIAFHISEGLGMQLFEDQPGSIALWPNEKDEAIRNATRVCDNWNKWVGIEANRWDEKEYCKEEEWELCFQNDSGV